MRLHSLLTRCAVLSAVALSLLAARTEECLEDALTDCGVTGPATR